VRAETCSPTPRKAAISSMDSSSQKVLSTSKQKASAERRMASVASVGVSWAPSNCVWSLVDAYIVRDRRVGERALTSSEFELIRKRDEILIEKRGGCAKIR